MVEARKPTEALQVLRNELAPLDVNANHLHLLSRCVCCSIYAPVGRRWGVD